MRKFFSLFAAVLFAGSMMATDVTLTMADYAATSFEAEGISVSTAKNTGSTNPAYNANGKDLRVYAKGSITIEAETNITAISFVISAQGQKRLAPLTANTGSVEMKGTPDFSAVWTGSAKSVTLTVGDKADYGTENTKAGQLCFTGIEVTLEGGTSTPKYYLVGSLIGWKPNADYRLKANPGQEGEYMIDAVLAAKEGIKVIGVLGQDTTWYKDGIGNEYIINETGKYTVYFRPEGNQQWGYTYFEPVKATCPLYNVAEAIAAKPSKDDEMFVRGVVTKIEIKGSNFKNYGSANIYVKDATGATGEFEFYNSYSIKGAKYTTTDPAYDATSTAFKQFDAVSDGTYTVTVGDTVVAYGKYDYYSSTHELQQNCYIVEISEGEKPEPETINVTMSEGLRFLNYDEEDWWQLYGADDKFDVSVSNISDDYTEGTYTMDQLDADFTYVGIIEGTDTTYVEFKSGSVTLSIAENGNVTITGTLVGKDNNNYVFNLVFVEPKAKETKNVTIPDAELDDEYAEDGLYGIYGLYEDEFYVQIGLWVDGDVEGTYTEYDFDNEYIGTEFLSKEGEIEYYKATVVIAKANDGGYTITVTLLGYNNVQYNIVMTVPGSGTGIEAVNANTKAVKTIKDGQLLIMKGNKTFNMTGVRIR